MAHQIRELAEDWASRCYTDPDMTQYWIASVYFAFSRFSRFLELRFGKEMPSLVREASQSTKELHREAYNISPTLISSSAAPVDIVRLIKHVEGLDNSGALVFAFVMYSGLNHVFQNSHHCPTFLVDYRDDLSVADSQTAVEVATSCHKLMSQIVDPVAMHKHHHHFNGKAPINGSGCPFLNADKAMSQWMTKLIGLSFATCIIGIVSIVQTPAELIRFSSGGLAVILNETLRRSWQ